MWIQSACLLLPVVLFAQSAAPTYEYFTVGNPADVKAAASPGFALIGGGKDLDPAFRWLLKKSGGGDLLVLRASGTGAYNDYIKGLGGVDSVETLVVKTAEAARDPFVLDKIRKAEALFIAGGDQWNYVRIWGASPMRAEIQGLIDRGIPVGGTSAGLAVLGQFVFTAEKNTVTSPQALQNPYDERVTVGTNFLNIPLLRNVITDTHFVARDRLGRLLAMMARILADGKSSEARAIAVDERTAALVEPDGTVAIEGEGPVYFMRATGEPELCRAGSPLSIRAISVYRVKHGGSFNLKQWRGAGGTSYELSVKAGVVNSNQSGGSLY